MTSSMTTDIVADPVSHISISGVHGRDELDKRLANAPEFHARDQRTILVAAVAGAAVGAALMYLLKR
jgi:hypothetical protein